MRILHLVPGLSNPANGIAVAAKLIAAAQGADLVDCRQAKYCNMSQYDEVWVHSMWTPQVWLACRRVLKAQSSKSPKPPSTHNPTIAQSNNLAIPQSHNPTIAQSHNRTIPQSHNRTIPQLPTPRLVRMLHGCLDPLRVAYHGWKKRLVAPIERRLFAKCDRVVVTGAWEESWCRQWGVASAFESIDLRKYFRLPTEGECQNCPKDRPLHLLYLGRPHPLKGLDVLNAAIHQFSNLQSNNPKSNNQTIDFRSIGTAFGSAKDDMWAWCDVLVLPTLSENFGLVVAEALERGKRVITTDGAPAWRPETNGKWIMENDEGIVSGYGGRLLYLTGYRDGTDDHRVRLLTRALGLVGES